MAPGSGRRSISAKGRFIFGGFEMIYLVSERFDLQPPFFDSLCLEDLLRDSHLLQRTGTMTGFLPDGHDESHCRRLELQGR